MQARKIENSNRIKVRSAAAHMPTRAMQDRSKYTRKVKHRKQEW